MSSTATGTSLITRVTVIFSVLVITLALPQQFSNSTLLIKIAVLDRCQPDFVTVSGPQCLRTAAENRLPWTEPYEVTDNFKNVKLGRQSDRHDPRSAVKVETCLQWKLQAAD